MAIPASVIVDVMPRVINGGSNNLEFNGLIFTHNEIISATTGVLTFTSVATVGAYFGLDSDEYKAAQIYFAGYNNKYAAPRALLFARRIDDLIDAWVRSAPNQHSLAEYQEITNGSIEIEIDGRPISVTGVNFSNATSLSDVGEELAGAIAEAGDIVVNVLYSSVNRSFTIYSSTLGAESSVSFPTDGESGTGLASYMRFTEASGAVQSKGSGPLTLEEQMADILEVTQNWVTYTTLWEASTEEILELAAWASSHFGWLYCAYTTQDSVLVPDTTTDPGSLIIDNQYDHTAISYGPIDYAVFLMGVAASIAWQRLNGTITFAFKSQAGLTAYVLKEADAATLKAKRYNYYGNFATRNANFIWEYEGLLSASAYNFIDPYVNAIWFTNRIQVALMGTLGLHGRIPYNQRGYSIIRAAMLDPVTEALNNAAIEPGVVLSESQKSALFNEAGLDISDELWLYGYYIPVLDPGAPIRAQRQSPIVNIWYTYGGSIHRLEVAATAVL